MGNLRYKFRAWDEQNKVMHNEVEFIRSGIDGNDWILFKSDKQKLEDGNVLNNPYFQQQIKLMQYTGLKDKNDVEIYEGDIVIITEEDEDSCLGREFSYKGVVSYANSLKLSQYVSQYPSSFCLISKSFYREQSLLFNDRWDYEVIGNIYEDSHLLDNN